MAESSAAKPPVDTVDVTFPSQYKHLMPNQTYRMTFGEVFSYRNDNAAAPKAEPKGPNKDAFLQFEAATLKRLSGKK